MAAAKQQNSLIAQQYSLGRNGKGTHAGNIKN